MFKQPLKRERAMARKLPLVVACFLAIYLIWGSTYLAVVFGLQSIPPLMLMGIRSLAGGIILLTLGWRGIAAVSVSSWASAMACGLLFFLGCHGILAYAQQTVPSGIAAIVLATVPFWIVLLEYVLPGEKRPSPWKLLALLPGFAGVALIAWQNVSERPLAAGSILLLLASASSWAAGSLLSKRTSSAGSGVSISGMQLAAGGVALLFVSLVIGEFRDFSPDAVSTVSLAAVAYLVLAGSVVGFAAFHWLLDTVPTTQVSTYTFVNPVVAVGLGWFFLQEQLSLTMLLGGMMVVGSVVAIWRVESISNTRPTKTAKLRRLSLAPTARS
jgi:drug/metabolite transporter (DMT)-like permease